MKTEMSFGDYIKNPSGGRTMMAGEKDVAAEIYNKKYSQMMLRVAGMIEYTLFRKDNDRFVIWMKMPSEGTKDLYYDVVVEFFTKDKVKKDINKLDEYFIKFFSNDPNFIFTFAYVFNQKRLIVPELIKKISKEALKTNPATTNPNKIVGYVKSLYFAYLFITSHGLMNKMNWLNAINGNDKINAILSKQVMDSEKKLIQAQKLKKIEKANKSGSLHIADPEDMKELDYKVKAYTASAKKVKQINQVKKVGYVKKVRKIGKIGK